MYKLLVRLNAPPLSNVTPTIIATGNLFEMLELSNEFPGSWVENLIVSQQDNELRREAAVRQ